MSEPSNNACRWDGIDLKDRKPVNPLITYGVKYGSPAHNFFGLDAFLKPGLIYRQVRNKKTGRIENSKERGGFDCTYVSRVAYGKTIFGRYNLDYVKATGAKEYK